MKEVAERIAPPRTLYCEFPLGRPLGRPDDAELQRNVLTRGLGLLSETASVFDTYPEIIESDETPLSCALPPRFDASLPPAVDEARGLRAAYDRAREANRVTAVGRAIDVDTIESALDALHQWAQGAPWKEVALPGKNTVAVCHDIRAYYTEAALELATAPAGSRSVEAWFYEDTEAGKTMMAARAALEAQGAPFGFWFYMAPGHR